MDTLVHLVEPPVGRGGGAIDDVQLVMHAPHVSLRDAWSPGAKVPAGVVPAEIKG